MFGLTEGLVLASLLLIVGAGLWGQRHASRRAAGRRTRVVQAQVVDIGAVDVRQNDRHVTLHRVVLLFMQESGEPVAVDKTARFTRDQLGVLIPGRIVTIAHDPRAPDNFEIDFASALVDDPASSRPAGTIYGPPS